MLILYKLTTFRLQAGDPIKASAIGRTLWNYCFRDSPIYICMLPLIYSLPLIWSGAVGSNIGHLEGASGIAGITKTMFILEASVIPPSVN